MANSSSLGHLVVSFSPSFGNIVTRRHASILSGSCNSARPTVSSLRESSPGSSFNLDARRSRDPRTKFRATSFRLSRIRSAAGRRHHRRRDEDFPADLRPKESMKSDLLRPRESEKVRSTNRSREDEFVITLDMETLKHRAADAVVDAQRAAGRSVAIAQRAAGRSVVVAQRAAEESAVTVQRAAELSVDRVVRFARAAAQESVGVWNELRSSVRIQKDRHVEISIRRSSLEFAGRAVLGFILLVVFTKLLLNGVKKYGWGWEEGSSRSTRVVRDRSLAGKEVLVDNRVRMWEGGPTRKTVQDARGLWGPLDIPVEDSRSEKELLKSARARGEGAPATKKAPRLPGWWPEPDLPPTGSIDSRQRAEEEAHRLVQGIMQSRLSGYDFSTGDIIQLRQLCKASGAQVNFDTYNTRDSFYRAAINFVLSACQGAGKFSLAEFGSEGGIRFIVGLAMNIGLESGRAATMVNAAVAARTRAGLLQARALRMQSKFAESEEELSRLIRLHSSFRPDLNSAEMEMVAQGLGSHFDKQARIEMLEMYEILGGTETKRVAEEALGLLRSS